MSGIPPGFFLTGPQISITIQRNDTGALVQMDGVRTMFNVKETDQLLTSEPIDNGGRVVNQRVPKGITGTIDVDRGNANFSEFMAEISALYYSTGQQVPCTITTTEPSADGSGTTKWQHTYCVFHNYDPGSWEKANILKAKVEFAGTERLQVA